jgi:hypothetical protein
MGHSCSYNDVREEFEDYSSSALGEPQAKILIGIAA